MSLDIQLTPLREPDYATRLDVASPHPVFPFNINGPRVYRTRAQQEADDAAYARSLPDSCFVQLTPERDAEIRALYAAFGGVARTQSPFVSKNIEVLADTRAPYEADYKGSALYNTEDGCDDSTAEDRIQDDMMVQHEESEFVVPLEVETFDLATLSPSSLGNAGGAVPRVVVIETVKQAVPPVEQHASPLPIEAVRLILNYVPGSFKVARGFVPSLVLTVEERMQYISSNFFDPNTLSCCGDEEERDPGDIRYSFSEATDEHHSWLRSSAVTKVVANSRSPDEAFRMLMIAKFGLGACQVVSSRGHIFTIYDYQTINSHSYYAHIERSDGDCYPDHFVSHFLGLLPPRRVTTYSAGLLRVLTNQEPTNDQDILTTQGVPRTTITGPLRVGHVGACLLDPHGNLTGFINIRSGIPCINIWHHDRQSWYSAFPCSSEYSKWAHYHRAVSVSTPEKMPGAMIDYDTHGCDSTCCTLRYYKFPFESTISEPDLSLSSGHTPWFHLTGTKCGCGGCMAFKSRTYLPCTRFLREAYIYMVHQSLFNLVTPDEAKVVISFIRKSNYVHPHVRVFFDIVRKYLSKWNVHCFVRCHGDCRLCSDAEVAWNSDR